jgi:hypothetical protein
MMSCSTGESGSINHGKVLNISQSGCMARINGLDPEDHSMTLSIVIPDETEMMDLEVQAEHLWISRHDGACYHGFKFKELPPEKSVILSEYLARLVQQQQMEVKPVTA